MIKIMQENILASATHKFSGILNNADNTLLLGKKIGELAQRENIKLILLYGALGAGKTTFTRAFVSAFKYAQKAEVSSPTFTLVNHYPTLPAIIHADIYRLAEMVNFSLEDLEKGKFPALNLPEELEEILYDTIDNSTYTLIEWADFLDSNELTKERLDIFLEISDNQRPFSLYAYTTKGKKLLEDLAKSL